MQNNAHKIREIVGKILHETEVIIHGVSIVDLDWAEVIGIRLDIIHFSKTLIFGKKSYLQLIGGYN